MSIEAELSTLTSRCALTRRDFLTPLRGQVTNTDQFNRIVIRFNQREEEGWNETYEETRPDNQYHHNDVDKPIEVEAPFWDPADAKLYAQRFLTTDARPIKTWSTTVPWHAFFIELGEQVLVKEDRINFNQVMEVLEVKHNLAQSKIDITFGNRRGWNDTFGYWTAGTHTTDTDYAWSGTWTDDEKIAARQGFSFWQGTHLLADDADPASMNCGRWW